MISESLDTLLLYSSILSKINMIVCKGRTQNFRYRIYILKSYKFLIEKMNNHLIINVTEMVNTLFLNVNFFQIFCYQCYYIFKHY